ncbi:MAG: hypothetical protein HYX90_00690 [Chloroflexi bacterium]|nr:hypothetical protein [Chloroflexota bacterium]
MLVTLVLGGLAVAYLPTQISDTPGLQETWQAKWGSEIATFGLAVVAIGTVIFLATHIKWPHWITDSKRLRVRLYKQPYGPDTFFKDAQSRFAGFLQVTKKQVELEPYGWDRRDPFIRITYHVFNGSQFLVLFEDIHGELYVGQSKLHDKPTLNSGQGWWPSQATALLKIDQKVGLEFWEQLHEDAKHNRPIRALKGNLAVSVKAQSPGVNETRISLSSDSPFLVA